MSAAHPATQPESDFHDAAIDQLELVGDSLPIELESLLDQSCDDELACFPPCVHVRQLRILSIVDWPALGFVCLHAPWLHSSLLYLLLQDQLCN